MCSSRRKIELAPKILNPKTCNCVVSNGNRVMVAAVHLRKCAVLNNSPFTVSHTTQFCRANLLTFISVSTFNIPTNNICSWTQPTIQSCRKPFSMSRCCCDLMMTGWSSICKSLCPLLLFFTAETALEVIHSAHILSSPFRHLRHFVMWYILYATAVVGDTSLLPMQLFLSVSGTTASSLSISTRVAWCTQVLAEYIQHKAGFGAI